MTVEGQTDTYGADNGFRDEGADGIGPNTLEFYIQLVCQSGNIIRV